MTYFSILELYNVRSQHLRVWILDAALWAYRNITGSGFVSAEGKGFEVGLLPSQVVTHHALANPTLMDQKYWLVGGRLS